MLTDWLLTAGSIWRDGFEAWREAVEVRPLEQGLLGQQLGFGTLEAVKGCGRTSVLLFSVAYTYKSFRNMTDEETKDFKECLS